MTIAEKPKRVWMVYGLGRDIPTRTHPSVEAARREANRLSRANPGTQFHVLGSEYIAETATTRLYEFDGSKFVDISDDIPF
ncbi:hypothetical protein [Methylobacterium sp. Gmos1]